MVIKRVNISNEKWYWIAVTFDEKRGLRLFVTDLDTGEQVEGKG